MESRLRKGGTEMECSHELTFVQMLKPVDPQPYPWWKRLLGEPAGVLSVLWVCRNCGKELIPSFTVKGVKQFTATGAK